MLPLPAFLCSLGHADSIQGQGIRQFSLVRQKALCYYPRAGRRPTTQSRRHMSITRLPVRVPVLSKQHMVQAAACLQTPGFFS